MRARRDVHFTPRGSQSHSLALWLHIVTVAGNKSIACFAARAAQREFALFVLLRRLSSFELTRTLHARCTGLVLQAAKTSRQVLHSRRAPAQLFSPALYCALNRFTRINKDERLVLQDRHLCLVTNGTALVWH
jgi:hypothetical protein